jgi:hypothetical protein
MSFRSLLLIALLATASKGLLAQQRGKPVDPDAYVASAGNGSPAFLDTQAVIRKDTFRVVEYMASNDERHVVAFLKVPGAWHLVEDVPISTDIQSNLRAEATHVDSRGIHLDVYRGEDQLVEEDWVLGITRTALVPEHYNETWRRWQFGRGNTAQDAVLLSSHLWWKFREDPLLDVMAQPTAGVTIESTPEYFRLQDDLGNEVGKIDIQARLFAGPEKVRYLLVSAYFENGGEWPHVDEFLVKLDIDHVTLVEDGWQQGLSFKSLLKNPKATYDQEGTESEDLWYRISATSPSVWVGCRFDPAFSEVTAVNGVYFLEDLQYKAIELVWNPEKAQFEIGKKILR